MEVGAPFAGCEPGTLDEWLMERYSAFNSACGRKRFFRVWHEPWSQCRAQVEMADTSLLESSWNWFRDSDLVGANYSPCVRDVWLGRPRRITHTDHDRAEVPIRFQENLYNAQRELKRDGLKG